MIGTQEARIVKNQGVSVRDRKYWEERLAESRLVQYFDYEKYPQDLTSSTEIAISKLEVEASPLLNLTTSTTGHYLVFISAISLVARQYSGSKDVIMTSLNPASGKPMLNRIPLEDEWSFKETLTHVKTNFQQDLAYPTVPYQECIKLIDQADIPKVWVTYENLMSEQLPEVGYKDLHFHFSHDSQLTTELRFNPQVYHQTYIDSIVEHLLQLISDSLANPNLSFKNRQSSPLRTPKDLWTDISEFESTLDLFDHQVKSNQGAKAIIHEDTELTFEELDRRSNLLAYELIHQYNITKGDRIVVTMDRNPHFIVSVMGVLRSGAAFVPIDPKYPSERIHDIVKSADPKLLISEMYYSMDIDQFGVPAYIIDVQLGEGKVAKVPVQIESEDLAYILYTSGSTGKPKGVMVSHGGLVNYTSWAASTYCQQSDSNFAFFTSISFDLTLTSIFCPLVSGHAIIVVSEHDQPEELIRAVFAHKSVNNIKLTPSHLHLVLALSSEQLISKVNTLIVGGERFESNLAEDIFQLFDQKIRIFNEYGPTEATVGCMIYQYQEKTGTVSVPIGIAARNNHVLVLNEFLQPVPAGASGQLFIGGESLAMGYYGDQELTDSFFIRPFSDSDSRIYATGDSVRVLHDGQLEFVSRLDDQIKLRGNRIELGEIATVLTYVPHISRALVLIAGSSQKDQYLVAYLETSESLETEEVKRALTEKLPAYMVPEVYIQLPAMPLTSNGKIDLKKLPEPLVFGEEVSAAETETQITLVNIWADFLNWDPIQLSIDQDLFQIGVNSILAFQAAISIKKKLEKPVEVSHLFDYKTIREQSSFIDTLKKEVFLKIPRLADQELYRASPAQERMFFQYLLNPENLAYNIAGALLVSGDSDVLHLQEVIQKLVDRHPILRTTYIQEIDGVYQEIGGQSVQLEFLDAGQSLEDAFLKFVRPHDLGTSPVRFGYMEHSDGNFIVFVDVHHIACDGYSLNILINDMKLILAEKSLSEIELRYVDFAEWQKRQLATSNVETYWTNILEKRWPILDLNDVPVDDGNSWKAASGTLVPSIEQSEQIAALIRQSDSTNFMFFLSLYYLLLHKVSGNKDLIIGTDAIGRPHTDLDHVVGTFINILPLRVSVDVSASFLEWQSRVKRNVLEALEHQFFQYDDMVELVTRNGSEDILPIAKVHFAFDDFQKGKTAFEGGGYEFKPLDPEREPTTQYVFKIDARYEQERYWLDFIYSKTAFEEGTINVFMKYYNSMLNKVLENPTISVEDLVNLAS